MNLRKDHYHIWLGSWLLCERKRASCLPHVPYPGHRSRTNRTDVAPAHCGLSAKPTTVAVCSLSNQGADEATPIHFYLLQQDTADT